MTMDRVNRFDALVARDPGNKLFRFSLAQALDAAGDPRAEEHYRFCVDVQDDWMMPRILLGKWLLAAGRRDEAKSVLQAAHTLAVAQDHEEPEAELSTLLSDL